MAKPMAKPAAPATSTQGMPGLCCGLAGRGWCVRLRGGGAYWSSARAVGIASGAGFCGTFTMIVLTAAGGGAVVTGGGVSLAGAAGRWFSLRTTSFRAGFASVVSARALRGLYARRL